MLPPTYVFEGMRALLIEHVFRADLMIQAFAINIVLFALAILAFFEIPASGPPARFAAAGQRIGACPTYI